MWYITGILLNISYLKEFNRSMKYFRAYDYLWVLANKAGLYDDHLPELH
jgi:hypothetical protein